MQLRCCLFARKQRLLFESPALFEGVNIIRMGVNIVRMHSVGSTGPFEALETAQGDRARFYIDLGRLLSDQQGLQALRERLFQHAEKMDQIRSRIKAIQDRKDNPFGTESEA